VTGARAHSDERGEAGVIQAQPETHVGLAARLVAAEGVGYPPGLVGLDTDDADRFAKLFQVRGARRGDDDRAARSEDAADLGGVARPENAQDQRG
jgi:hypothetical protein